MGKRSGIGNKKEALEFDLFDAMDNLAIPDIGSLFDEPTLFNKPHLEEPQLHKRKPSRREFAAVQSNQYLHNVITTIPSYGETWHIVSNSRFNFWSFVPAVIGYLGNYVIDLYCVTWTTNRINTNELIEIFDSGKIGKIVFTVGQYFKTREAAVYAHLADALIKRKQTLIVGEHHAKILLLSNEENFITIESSANLCANPRTEQFTYSNCKELYNFHKQWIDSLMEQSDL